MPDEMQILAARPKSLDELLGAARMVKSIRALQGKPRAWMFQGPPGTGKTTTARIVALSLQLDDSEFGSPPASEWDRFGDYDIAEINASLFRGVDDMTSILESSRYIPVPPTKRRVIILDEAQRMSVPAQNLLLKPFEDGAGSTVWMICTTDPQKILPALRSRCTTFRLSELTRADVGKLMTRVAERLDIADSDGLDLLRKHVLAAGTRSPRQVVQAVEQYKTHGDARAAATQTADSVTHADTLKLCRAVVRGDWLRLKPMLKALTVEESAVVLRSVMGYLRAVMLGKSSGRKTQIAANGITRLSKMLFAGDQERHAALAAALYELCVRFKGGRWAQ